MGAEPPSLDGLSDVTRTNHCMMLTGTYNTHIVDLTACDSANNIFSHQFFFVKLFSRTI